jgi:hypothetical protein
MIGVLENDFRPLGSESGSIMLNDRRTVRVVFHRDGANWRAFPSYCPDQTCMKTISAEFPADTYWNIVFRGKFLGKVEGQIEPNFPFYAEIGLQDIVSKTTVPTIGDRSSAYAGFLGLPAYRPLVAVSAPYYNDPDGWRAVTPPAHILALARSAFHHRFPVALNCRNPNENIVRKTAYRDDQIVTIDAYTSEKGWYLIHLTLRNYNCDGPADDPYTGNTPFTDQWLAVSPADQISFLEASMSLVDAGDYDKSGSSDLVFSIDRYNQGGYVMYYNAFAQHVDFAFNYQ